MIFGLFGGNKKRVAEMISAARAGDMVKIQQLISTGADIDAPEPTCVWGDEAALPRVA
jgi:predicted aspartyl protease